MRHLGDICKINGADIEPVDVVTAGSPCQDLSVAGLRKGLLHADKGDEETTRSGLFMEQMRIIKEMRKAEVENGRTDKLVRPRYLVWENVQGATSSNNGDDFRCVLEEIAKVIQEDAVIPRPDTGKWTNYGSILLDNGSIAWRIHDAQYWGVPQRRRRICVLADFNGFTAPDILFAPEYRRESKGVNANDTVGSVGRGSGCEVQPLKQGVSGHTESCKQEGEETPGDSTDGT